MIPNKEKLNLEELDLILSWKKVDKKQVRILQNFIIVNIDPTCTICESCGSQIRYAFERVKNWSERHKEEINQIRNNVGK